MTRPVFHALFLAAVLAATLSAGGCSRRVVVLREGSEEERAAWITRRLEEGRGFLAQYPANPAAALEAAEQVLALDEDSVAARLVAADAWFGLRRYKESLAQVAAAEELAPDDEEVLYRKARGLYWFHTYWTRGNYARAREAAAACLAAGDRYLFECYTIIRNSHLGEDAANGPSRAAYEKAAASAEDLLGKLSSRDPRRGDVLLVLAELHALHLGDAQRGGVFLELARREAANDPSLARRVAAFDRDRALEQALAAR